jgi:hypothetical protein
MNLRIISHSSNWDLDYRAWFNIDVLPSPKLGPRWALVFKTTKLWGFEGTLLTPNTKRGKGAC